MRQLFIAAAISVTLFAAGCSSDGDPASQATTPATNTPSTNTPSTNTPPTSTPVPAGATVAGGMVTNAGFANGDGWIGSEGVLNIIDDGSGSNNVNYVNVASAAANAYDVNLSYGLTIEQGKTYTLSFKARSNISRTMIAGIGLYEGEFTNASETIDLTSGWQTYTLTLAASNFGSENSRVFFDMGAEAGEVWLDDVSLVEDTPTQSGSLALPVTFDDSNVTYSWTDFDGGVASVIDNPQTAGNSSAKVAQLTKGAGATWAGSFLTLDSAIDFSQGELFTMNFWSASEKKVLLKFEGTKNGANTEDEVEVTHTGGSAWQALSFDFSGKTAALGDVAKVVIIVENGTAGDGSAVWTFYADDIAQSVGSSTPPANSAPSTPLEIATVAIEDGFVASSPISQAEALNKGSISASSTAYEGTYSLQFVHNGEQEWGGFYANFTSPLDQSNASNLVFALSSAPAGANYFGVKLESSGAGQDAQLNILSYTPVTSGAWQVYTIPLADFTAFNGSFSKSDIKAIGFWNPTSSGDSLPPFVAADILIDGIHFQ